MMSTPSGMTTTIPNCFRPTFALGLAIERTDNVHNNLFRCDTFDLRLAISL
jgi:hypothetical protein